MRVKAKNSDTVMTFEDLMILAFVVVEGSQYIQLGPKFKEYNPYIDKISIFFSLLIPEIQEAEFS